MQTVLAVHELDVERDRRACIALDLKVTGTKRELAQWILNHHNSYSDGEIANWLGCGRNRILSLRQWAKRGFEGKPFRSGSYRARDKEPLESQGNFEQEEEVEWIEDGSKEVADPETVEDNALHLISRCGAQARALRKIFRLSSFDRGRKERLGNAIEKMIAKWRLAQSTLNRKD